jgi:hypothetical protein
VAHHGTGAPLVYFTLLAHQRTVRHCYIVVAHHMSGAPLVAISSIALFLVVSRCSAWVFDTGSIAHICNSKQELRNRRRLAKDEVMMRVGNGSKVDVIAVSMLAL